MNTSPVFFFWSLKDLCIIIPSVIISIVIWITLGTYVPLAFALLNAFLSIRTEEKSINEYLRLAFRYIFMQQKTYIFEEKEEIINENEKEKHK